MGLSRLGSIGGPRRARPGDACAICDAVRWHASSSAFPCRRRFLVAIWGIESNYGAQMGGFNMFEALATLAYDGPRQDFARKELLAALKMEQQEHLDPGTMTSSWARARLRRRRSSCRRRSSNMRWTAMATAFAISGIHRPMRSPRPPRFSPMRAGIWALAGDTKSCCRTTFPMSKPMSTTSRPSRNGASLA